MNIAGELLASRPSARPARSTRSCSWRPAPPPAAETKAGFGTAPMSLLPVEPACRLAEREEEHRWLITGLWSEQAVGIVGGEPKCCKSFLALDLAVAVAAGIPCLRRFAVPRAGPRPALCRRGRAAHRATPLRRHLRGRRRRARRSRHPGHHRPHPPARSRCRPHAASPTPSPDCSRACSSSIPSCACTASTRTPAARSRRCSPICASCSADMASPCSSSIMPRKAPATPAPDRPCAAHPSSTPGATPTSTCAATAMISRSPSSIAPRRRWRPSPSRLPSVGPPSHWRPSTRPSWPRRRPSTLDQRITAALADSAGAMPFAALRSTLPRPRRHPVRAPRRAHRRRPRRQDRPRLPPRRQLIATPPTITMKPPPGRRLPVPLPGIPTACGNGNWEARWIDPIRYTRAPQMP